MATTISGTVLWDFLKDNHKDIWDAFSEDEKVKKFKRERKDAENIVDRDFDKAGQHSSDAASRQIGTIDTNLEDFIRNTEWIVRFEAKSPNKN